jgi:hypothetical protein
MKEKLYCLLSIFAVAIFVGGCPFLGPVYEEDLGNGYVVCALDVMEDASVILKDSKRASGGTQVVPPTVFAYGWNKDFILAKRHPEKKDRTVDNSVTHWYIVEVASGNVHGPLSEGEFNTLRTKLKVPAELPFKTIQ